MTVAKPTANTNISISYQHTCSNLHIITNGDTIMNPHASATHADIVSYL